MKTYKLYGTPGNTTLETVLGTSANDNLYPMGGWDYVDGGAGTDTVWVQGPAAEFKIVMDAGVVFVDTVAGASAYANRVQLKEVEVIQFADKTVDLASLAEPQILMDERGVQDFIGGLATDTVVFDSPRDAYKLTPSGSKYFVAHTHPEWGQDTLQGIERLQFSDQSLALDVAQGISGVVAKILGVVFSPNAVNDRQLVGIGLHYGESLKNDLTELMRLALDARLGPQHSTADMVDLLYFNLFGQLPEAGLRSTFVGWIDSQQHTQESLALLAADLPQNLSNIQWMGLLANGLAYDPVLA